MVKVVVIDAGHGGNDPGAVGHGLKEKDISLYLSELIAGILSKEYGVKALLTREKDTDMTLSERTHFANKGSDCLVSIHVNAAPAISANGFESFIFTNDGADSKSAKLQDELHSRISKLWFKKNRADRGEKKANFHMLREYKGASVLLEFGFISNKFDAKLLTDSEFIADNARATAEGIAAFLGVTKSVTTSAGIYRVFVEGKQVGAYSDPDNLANQVKIAISSGKKNIKLQLA